MALQATRRLHPSRPPMPGPSRWLRHEYLLWVGGISKEDTNHVVRLDAATLAAAASVPDSEVSGCEILSAITPNPRGRQHRHTPVVSDWSMFPLMLDATTRNPSAPSWMRLGHLSLPVGYRAWKSRSSHSVIIYCGCLGRVSQAVM
jgi:hypothetical protein